MYYRGYAPNRKTEVGSLIEAFMDDNHESLSPDLWEKLNALGKRIDEMVEELEEHIDELNSQILD